jgi:5-methylthioribose kinase
VTAPSSIDAEGIGDYLRGREVVPADATVRAAPLGGGVSNTVLRVTVDGDCLVVKQPLANLAVEDDWPADVDRVHNEAAAARAYRTVIDRASIPDVRVPAVRFEDETDHVVGFECAPEGARTWKQHLLEGAVDARIARTLGRFLGASHRTAAGDERLRERFATEAPFRQLRLDPYHRTVARRHPEVAPAIEREIERIEGVARTLVHGDFSPKNVLVVDDEGERRGDGEGAPDGAGTTGCWLLDFEVAHWGDPAFDAAFMLNHLLLKSVHNAGDEAARTACVDAAREFWTAYVEAVPWTLEPATVRELAVLMLARIDGKSPVEYLTDPATKEWVRSVATTALERDVTGLDDYVTLLEERGPA